MHINISFQVCHIHVQMKIIVCLSLFLCRSIDRFYLNSYNSNVHTFIVLLSLSFSLVLTDCYCLWAEYSSSRKEAILSFSLFVYVHTLTCRFLFISCSRSHSKYSKWFVQRQSLEFSRIIIRSILFKRKLTKHKCDSYIKERQISLEQRNIEHFLLFLSWHKRRRRRTVLSSHYLFHTSSSCQSSRLWLRHTYGCNLSRR